MLALTLLHIASLLFASYVESREKPIEKYKSGTNKDVKAALEFLEMNDMISAMMSNKAGLANWNYASNLTEENKQKMLETEAEIAKFSIETWKNATSFAWKDFKDKNQTIYRWFKKLSVLGSAALPEEKLKRFNSLIADMQDTYAKAKVCAADKPEGPCTFSLEPELTEILRSSVDFEELKHAWAQWREVSGKKMRKSFLEYVTISNEIATLNGFKDAGEMWRDSYETETFGEDIDKLWKEIEPFYKQLHAYVRRKLIENYPKKGILPDGPIPAHLLGNIWGQTWGNIFELVKPFPEKKSIDVTKNMKKQKMTPLDMFKMSEEFFTSLGLIQMTPEFWNNSIIEKPTDREIVCHASAWDLSDGKDFRIKMCTKVNMEDFITVHHEMGHIEYYMQYAHQPTVFRSGANNGFHEAVGDVLALSVSTTTHLKKIGLLDDIEDDEESNINSLMKKALDKIAFLPFGYLIDAWRWKVFSSNISEDKLNTKWWEMRLKYQGLCPPVIRTEDDLDAAGKYHVIADVPYIRYFVSAIIQFQFHKALCDAAGYTGPLHKCDIYQNKEAGKVLSDTLKLGSSVHWKEAMSIITKRKTKEMDIKPMIEYFQPLFTWLKKQNINEKIGWDSNDPMICPQYS